MMIYMARGWESKSIEAQIETAMAQDVDERKDRLSVVEMVRLKKKEGLFLSRTRISNEIKTARNARYREMLELTLSHLDQELAALEKMH